MNAAKLISLFFLVVLLVLVQVSFFTRGWLNFILCLTLILFIMKKIKYGLFTVISGGILLDLYSPFPHGIFLFVLLLVLYISVIFSKRFSLENIFNIFFLGLLAGIVYKVCFLILAGLAYFLKISWIKIIINQDWVLHFSWFIFLNSILLVVIFLIKELSLKSRLRRAKIFKIYGRPFRYSRV